jgi:glycine dehydrogenase subunit 2
VRNQQHTQLIFELSRPGRRAHRLPPLDVPAVTLTDLIPVDALAVEPPPLPELAEGDVVRHFTNLSTLNMSVDTHFYPWVLVR